MYIWKCSGILYKKKKIKHYSQECINENYRSKCKSTCACGGVKQIKVATGDHKKKKKQVIENDEVGCILDLKALFVVIMSKNLS